MRLTAGLCTELKALLWLRKPREPINTPRAAKTKKGIGSVLDPFGVGASLYCK